MTEHPATQLATLQSALAAHGQGDLSAAALRDTARAQQALLAALKREVFGIRS